jgi:hypothetical protein
MAVMTLTRMIGRWAALVAAYVFVLNALLVTTLLAGTHPLKSASGIEFCAPSSTGPSAPDDDAAKHAEHLCKACLQHTAPTAVVSPPFQTLQLPPLANEQQISGLNWRLPRSSEHAFPHPRGPPA